MATSSSHTMQYAPLNSNIELPFYTALASLKINHDKLDDSARKILGLYETRPAVSGAAGGCDLQILGNALATDESSANWYRAEGIFKNVNTLEDYKNLDRKAILHQAGRMIWDAISDGTIFSCPSLLVTFTVISYADLKKFKFTHWFAFPALHCDPAWKASGADSTQKTTRLTPAETEALVNEVQTYKISHDARQRGFFLAKKDRPVIIDEIGDGQVGGKNEKDGWDLFSSDSCSMYETDSDFEPELIKKIGFEWKIAPIGQFEQGFFQGTAPDDQYIAFADPSTFSENPGWMMRNLLALCQKRWRLSKVQILCYRDTHARREEPRSIIFNLQTESFAGNPSAFADLQLEASLGRLSLGDMPKVTGWERNNHGELKSRMVTLGEQLDPERLADQSVDLNLKLMKWRIAPTLDLDKIKASKCLLLGAGTLGSYVARALLGWGVQHITLVDNGKVSFSNPVRQPLYKFEDCLNGGKEKAPQAAEALRQIYPGVKAKGLATSVPMAGHPVLNEDQTRQDLEKLEQLFDEHDVIFLLMDTRESRWLPTVIGKAKGKIVINAALGFDTYVVMRHGARDIHGNAQGEELGCYFCNDVVAPANSMKDQTLDQQCTVTRPGVAAIASALAVELVVSILQHTLGARAPAPRIESKSSRQATAAFAAHASDEDEQASSHPLGQVPHQIRGFLATFSNIQVHGPAYDCCSACSPTIVAAYEADGWNFVKRAMNEKGFVEELSGLAQVQRRAEEASSNLEWDSEGGLDDGEGELL
ncbi:MAG: Autophagy protein 7 [Vezdaea aestivalis]|nr:MAG: Autophagy protein 7 [Vezdaea aestivalis]